MGMQPFLRRPWVAGVALVLLVLAVHGRVVANDFVDFDDPGYVTQNFQVLQGLSWSGMRWAISTHAEANWHPLTWLSHMLDVELFDLASAGHHATSLLLHAANAWLLFQLLRRWTASEGAAFCAAALLGTHPLHVESVAWISERKDVLSGFFFLASLSAYTAYAQRGGIARYLGSLLLFALGLCSKPMVVTLPCVLLLLDWWPLRRAMSAKLALEKLPFFLLSAASCLVTLLVQRSAGAVSAGGDFALGARVENALVSYARYLGKIFWPSGLSAFYPHRAAMGEQPWSGGVLVACAVLLVAITIACLGLCKRRAHATVGWLWFLGTLVPAIGLVQVGLQSMADRYAYIPSIGIYWTVVLLAREAPVARRTLLALFAAVLVACSALTWRQIGFWKDSATLARRALAVTQDNWMAHQILGMVHLREGDLEQASRQFEAALAIFPGTAIAHNNLGTLKSQAGAKAEALAHFREALRIDPSFAEAHNNIASLLGEIGNAEEAEEHFRRALEIEPNHAEAHNNYAALLGNLGRVEEAIEHLEAVLRIDPLHAGAHLNLGVAYTRRGDAGKARESFEAAKRLDPDGEVGRTASALLQPPPQSP
jgi:tetratricopeptide (TPR) repeat protein